MRLFIENVVVRCSERLQLHVGPCARPGEPCTCESPLMHAIRTRWGVR